MGFFFKAFPAISHISQNGVKKLFKTPIFMELRQILKIVILAILIYFHYSISRYMTYITKLFKEITLQ